MRACVLLEHVHQRAGGLSYLGTKRALVREGGGGCFFWFSRVLGLGGSGLEVGSWGLGFRV